MTDMSKLHLILGSGSPGNQGKGVADSPVLAGVSPRMRVEEQFATVDAPVFSNTL